MQEHEPFITLKGNKEGFPYHMSCRLLNSSKTNIGKISKILIDEIDSAVLSSIKISYQKNTFPVLDGLGKPRTNKLHHLYVLM